MQSRLIGITLISSLLHLGYCAHLITVAQAEGSLWRAMALLVAGGQLHAAATVLRDAGAVDAVHGLAAACREACAEGGVTKQVDLAIITYCSCIGIWMALFSSSVRRHL